VNPTLDVPPGDHQAVPELEGMAGEERDGVIVLIQPVVPIVLVACQERADEARSLPNPATVLLEVKSITLCR
jgi:hypothetical protein